MSDNQEPIVTRRESANPPGQASLPPVLPPEPPSSAAGAAPARVVVENRQPQAAPPVPPASAPHAPLPDPFADVPPAAPAPPPAPVAATPDPFADIPPAAAPASPAPSTPPPMTAYPYRNAPVPASAYAAAPSPSRRRLLVPAIIAVVVLVVVAGGLFIALAGGGGSLGTGTYPSRNGMFVAGVNGIEELIQGRGGPPDSGIPVAASTQPSIFARVPDLYLPYLSLSSESGAGRFDYISENTADGALLLTPRVALPPDLYCFSQGDPMVPAAFIPHWCFYVS